MFLRNFDNTLLTLCGIQANQIATSPTYPSANSSNGTSVFGDGYYNIKCTNGSIVATNAIKVVSSSAYSNFMYSGPLGICLGTGTTPVTYDDFNLSGTVISNASAIFKCIASTTTYDENTHRWAKSGTFTYTNTTGTDITINEWGIYAYIAATNVPSTYNNNNANYVLYYKEVLDTPIVIPAGSTATFTLTFELPMPNHP